MACIRSEWLWAGDYSTFVNDIPTGCQLCYLTESMRAKKK